MDVLKILEFLAPSALAMLAIIGQSIRASNQKTEAESKQIEVDAEKDSQFLNLVNDLKSRLDTTEKEFAVYRRTASEELQQVKNLYAATQNELRTATEKLISVQEQLLRKDAETKELLALRIQVDEMTAEMQRQKTQRSLAEERHSQVEAVLNDLRIRHGESQAELRGVKFVLTNFASILPAELVRQTQSFSPEEVIADEKSEK